MKKPNLGRIIIPVAILGSMGVLGAVSESDYAAEIQYQEQRCAMLKAFKNDTELGIAPLDRRGWPEGYHGEYEQLCGGSTDDSLSSD